MERKKELREEEREGKRKRKRKKIALRAQSNLPWLFHSRADCNDTTHPTESAPQSDILSVFPLSALGRHSLIQSALQRAYSKNTSEHFSA